MHSCDFSGHRFLGSKWTASLACSILRSSWVVLFLVIILLSGFACSSMKQGTDETANNNEKMNKEDHLEKIELYVGTTTQTHFVSTKWIAGIDIIAVDSTHAEAFAALLTSLELEREPVASEPNQLVLYKPIEASKISMETAVKELRSRFGICFGPALYDLDMTFEGALLDQLKVQFDKHVSKEKRDAVIESVGAKEEFYNILYNVSLVSLNKEFNRTVFEITQELSEEVLVEQLENVVYSSHHDDSIEENQGFKLAEVCFGDRIENVYINKKYVVTCLDTSIVSNQEFDSTFQKHNIKWSTELNDDSRKIFVNAPLPLAYRFIERITNQPFGSSDGDVLTELRSPYTDAFGPALFHDPPQVRGILTNKLIVGFGTDISRESCENRLLESGATKLIYQPIEQRFFAEYPRSVGYEIIDVAKKLYNRSETSYVEHVITTIQSPD